MNIKKTLKTLALSLAFAEGVFLLWMVLTKEFELLIALIVLPCGMVGFGLPIMLIALIIDHFKKKRKQDETDIDDLLESIFDEDDEPSEPAPATETSRRLQAEKKAAEAAASYAIGKAVTQTLGQTKTARKLSSGNPNADRYKEVQDRATQGIRERREKAEAERKKRWEEQEKEQKKKREEERKKRLG